MPRIQNISLDSCFTGNHFRPTDSDVLIQIVDPDMDFPDSPFIFGQVHQFKFLDIEYPEHPAAFRKDQAAQIASVLQNALENDLNVIVHCHAGICRSGAVAEVGVILGFEDCGNYRQPNLLVKHSLLRALGMYYDDDETPTETYQGQTNEFIYGQGEVLIAKAGSLW